MEPVDGLHLLTARNCVLLISESFEQAVQGLGLLGEGGFERALSDRSGPRGRSQTSIVALPGSSARLHLRPVRAGGWLAALRGGGLFSLARPIAELRATANLAAAGARVPTPVLVMARRKGPLWNAAVGTVFEEESRPPVSTAGLTEFEVRQPQ